MTEYSPEKRDMPALKGTIHNTGLDLPEDMTFEEWEYQLSVVWWLYQWSPWALGDMLKFGADHFPDRYEQAVATTGRALKTLYNKTWLARQFPKERGLRSEVLSPSHHEVLAGLPDEEKRYFLKEGERLDRESNGHLTVPQWTAHVREERQAMLQGKTQKADPPAKCGDCFGTGKCPRCHGSGEEQQ